jgi:hypothetical protein
MAFLNKPQRRFWFGVGLTVMVALLSAALTGAGEGSYASMEISYGPWHIVIFLWPLAVWLAHSPMKLISLAARAAVGVYYIWLVCHFSLIADFGSDLAWEVSHLRFTAPFFLLWLFSFLGLQLLIWVPITELTGHS